MGYVGQHELMHSCHQVLIAYLQLLAGLAGDDLGAREVMNQLQLQVGVLLHACGPQASGLGGRCAAGWVSASGFR